MKKYPLICMFLLLFSSNFLISQTVEVYSETFNSGFGGWTNTNLSSPWNNQIDFMGETNQWYTGDGESGMAAGVCGAANQGNPTLHMGWTGSPTGGAAYHSDAQTNKRISSPNINTTGFTNMTLGFNFIGNGCDTRDKAYFQYSIDGGTSWISPPGAPTSANPAMGTGGSLNNLKAQVCGSGQGMWTNLTWDLPATCENITNLRIAFVWQNSDNVACASGSPTDPSFAVDNIIITAPDLVPIELFYFNGKNAENSVMLEWATVSELNNDFFTIEKSTNGTEFTEIATIGGAGNSNEIRHYTYTDNDVPPDIVYYRLKQTDFDGTASYSKVISMEINAPPDIVVYPNPPDEYLFVEISGMKGEVVFIEFIDMMGRRHLSQQMEIEYDSQTLPVAVDALSGGGYVLRIVSSKHIITRKIKIN